jgi:Tfp pilus assembly protein PilF
VHDAHDPGFGEGSQYAAHLDRGWQLFDKGQLVPARASAMRARELNPEVPDASMLLAAVALADGDHETALGHYDDALDSDPDYVEAHLAACQLLAYDLEQPDAALRRLGTAEPGDTTPMERMELRLLAAECHLALDQRSRARTALDRLEDTTRIRIVLDADADDETRDEELIALFGGSELLELDHGETLDVSDRDELSMRAIAFSVRLGRAWLDAARLKRATSWLEAVCRRDPNQAEAWLALAEAHHADGDAAGSIRAAARALQLEAELPLPDWAPGAVELQDMVTEAVARTQVEAARAAVVGDDADAPIVLVIHELPPLEIVLEGSDPRVIAMALGIRDPRDGAPTLTAIAVYRRNLVLAAGHAERMPTVLSASLDHELAHFFQTALPGDEPADARPGAARSGRDDGDD